jgi:small GTP-binding protein
LRYGAGVQSILSDPAARDLADDTRRVLEALGDQLEALGTPDEGRRALGQAVSQLDELFLVVVVGEFNSGKSAFINALVGEAVLEEGVTPTTARIHLLQHGEARSATTRSAALDVVTAPLPLLRELHVVDTPGTNAVMREHEALTRDFVPRADLVLFVSSADRPFTETERQFMAAIAEWGKKVVIVLNKADLFEQEDDLGRVLAFVREQARAVLGDEPPIFAVSARLAKRAKDGDPASWAPSRFEALEQFIRGTLDQREKVRLKLASPLGIARALVRRSLDVAEQRLELLATDVQLIGDIDRQLATARGDMQARFEDRMAAVDNALLRMEQRGHAYFDEMLRIGRVFDLLDRRRVETGFERTVVADTPSEVERAVDEIIDWLVNTDLRQWRAVAARVGERAREHRERLVGDPEVEATVADRARLADAVGGRAQRVVESYDRRREASALAESARAAVATTAAVGAGAVGLGAAVTALATTAAADVTGLLMAGLVGTLGLLVIPARRRRAKQELRHRMSELRASLANGLREQFALEMQRSSGRIEETIAPYTRFVRAERERLETALRALRDLDDEIASLAARVERL